MSNPRFTTIRKEGDRDFSAIGKAVQNVAETNNVPSMVRPHDKSAEPPPPATVVPLKPAAKPTHRLTVDIPATLYGHIKDRAKTSTVKFVVLKAFADAGYHIDAEDLIEDGRRTAA